MSTTLTVRVAVAVTALVGVTRLPVAPLLAQDRVATVLAQVRSALGGEQKLAAVKALSIEGPFRRAVGSRSVEGTIALLLVRPDKLRRSEESTFFGSTSQRISTFNGAEAWDETVNAARVGGGAGGFDHNHGTGGGGAPFELGADHNHAEGQYQDQHQPESAAGRGGELSEEQLNAARIRRMKMELQRWSVAFLADSNQPFADAGRAESPEGSADVLETRDEANRAVRYFIDPTSHMPLMVQYEEVRLQAIPAQGAPKTTTVALHLSDYKKVDGVMLPHEIDTSVNGQASESWTIETIKVNPAVKASLLQKKAK